MLLKRDYKDKDGNKNLVAFKMAIFSVKGGLQGDEG
jgi:hypothetical protein